MPFTSGMYIAVCSIIFSDERGKVMANFTRHHIHCTESHFLMNTWLVFRI